MLHHTGSVNIRCCCRCSAVYLFVFTERHNKQAHYNRTTLGIALIDTRAATNHHRLLYSNLCTMLMSQPLFFRLSRGAQHPSWAQHAQGKPCSIAKNKIKKKRNKQICVLHTQAAEIFYSFAASELIHSKNKEEGVSSARAFL